MKIFNNIGDIASQGIKKVSDKMSDNIKPSQFMVEFTTKLKEAKNSKAALEMLEEAVEKGDFVQQNGVLFKHGDYTIQCMLKTFAEPYVANMKKIDALKLDSAPKLIGTLDKEGLYFIVAKVPGTKTGELIPYERAMNLVSKEDKALAFKDLQKVAKAGLIDNNIANGRLWFVAPDNNKIIFPSWEALRPLDKNEGSQALNNCYQILFNR